MVISMGFKRLMETYSGLKLCFTSHRNSSSENQMERCISVSVVTELRARRLGFSFWQKQGFLSLRHSTRTAPFAGGTFPGGGTSFHMVLRLGVCGAVPPLHLQSSWHDVWPSNGNVLVA
jgi:hypothetical protein